MASPLPLSFTPPPTSPVQIPDTGSIKASVILYGALVAISLSIYSVLRKSYPSLMTPRLAANTTSTATEQPSSVFSCKFWEIDLSFSWRSLALREKDLVRLSGVDGYVFIRIVRFFWLCLTGYCVIGVVLLIPAYYTPSIEVECESYCRSEPTNATNAWSESTCICGIQRVSLANVKFSSRALWAPVLVMYLLTFFTLWASRMEYQEMVRIRGECLQMTNQNPEAYSVLVEHIPEHLRDATGKRLFEYFEGIFPGKLISVEMLDTGGNSPSLQQLETIGETRNRVLWSLERAIATNQFRKVAALSEDLDVLNSRFRRCRKRYDSARFDPETDHFHQRHSPTAVPELDQNEDDDTSEGDKLRQEEEFFKEKREQEFCSAFVTFRSLVASTVASGTPIDESSDMRVIPAPEPKDVAWDNIGMSTRARLSRRAITKTAFYIVLMFWGVFTSVVAAATSTEALSRQVPALRDLLYEHPNLSRYLDMLAPLVLVSAVGVVNPILSFLARSEGRISETAAEKRQFERYFLFLVVQVFIFFSVSGVLFKTVVEILQQPSKIVTTLSSTIPKNAAFYIQFIIVKLFWMLCFELLRGSEILIASLRRLVAGYPRTAREESSLFCGCCFEVKYAQPKNLPSSLAQLLLVYFIAIVYSTIQPLILPTAFVFFALANVVYTTAFTTASRQMWDSKGRFWWNSVYRCLILGLIVSQLTLIGVLLIKGAYISQSLPLWLLVPTTVFLGYKTEGRYAPLVSQLSLHLAARIDAVRQDSPVIQLKPEVWQYGAIVPGETFNERDRAVIVYSYTHPVLDEPLKARPKLNKDSFMKEEANCTWGGSRSEYGAI